MAAKRKHDDAGRLIVAVGQYSYVVGDGSTPAVGDLVSFPWRSQSGVRTAAVTAIGTTYAGALKECRQPTDAERAHRAALDASYAERDAIKAAEGPAYYAKMAEAVRAALASPRAFTRWTAAEPIAAEQTAEWQRACSNDFRDFDREASDLARAQRDLWQSARDVGGSESGVRVSDLRYFPNLPPEPWKHAWQGDASTPDASTPATTERTFTEALAFDREPEPTPAAMPEPAPLLLRTPPRQAPKRSLWARLTGRG